MVILPAAISVLIVCYSRHKSSYSDYLKKMKTGEKKVKEKLSVSKSKIKEFVQSDGSMITAIIGSLCTLLFAFLVTIKYAYLWTTFIPAATASLILLIVAWKKVKFKKMSEEFFYLVFYIVYFAGLLAIILMMPK
jgi:hypothetical protein